MMYKALKELYRRGKINAAGIEKAAADGIITRDQANEIMQSRTQ